MKLKTWATCGVLLLAAGCSSSSDDPSSDGTSEGAFSGSDVQGGAELPDGTANDTQASDPGLGAPAAASGEPAQADAGAPGAEDPAGSETTEPGGLPANDPPTMDPANPLDPSGGGFGGALPGAGDAGVPDFGGFPGGGGFGGGFPDFGEGLFPELDGGIPDFGGGFPPDPNGGVSFEDLFGDGGIFPFP